MPGSIRTGRGRPPHEALEPPRLRVSLIGSSDASATAALARFFGEVHGTATRTHMDTVVVDLHDLYFMHTSCLKQLVIWFGKIATEAPAQRYRVHLAGSSTLPWQARTFDALRTAGGADFVTVSID